jgi:Tfp pilus assembly protein PilN
MKFAIKVSGSEAQELIEKINYLQGLIEDTDQLLHDVKRVLEKTEKILDAMPRTGTSN